MTLRSKLVIPLHSNASISLPPSLVAGHWMLQGALHGLYRITWVKVYAHLHLAVRRILSFHPILAVIIATVMTLYRGTIAKLISR